MTATEFWEKYHVALISLALAIVAAVGVSVVTPGERIDQLAAAQRQTWVRVDTLELRFQADSLKVDSEQRAIRDWVRPLLVGECLDRSPRELNLMRINCDSLLSVRAR